MDATILVDPICRAIIRMRDNRLYLNSTSNLFSLSYRCLRSILLLVFALKKIVIKVTYLFSIIFYTSALSFYCLRPFFQLYIHIFEFIVVFWTLAIFQYAKQTKQRRKYEFYLFQFCWYVRTIRILSMFCGGCATLRGYGTCLPLSLVMFFIDVKPWHRNIAAVYFL
jgi:hypothetical protein